MIVPMMKTKVGCELFFVKIVNLLLIRLDREKAKVKHAPWNRPEGRLARLGTMKLVDSDEALYVPVTQEPVPKTEDQLEDDAEVMLKLGPGSGKSAISSIVVL